MSKNFVSHQMQADCGRLGLIKKESGNRLLNICAERFPSIGLGENVVRKAFCHTTAIGFLCYGKDYFHVGSVPG